MGSLSRRTLLKGLGAGVGLGVAGPALGGLSSALAASPANTKRAGSLPFPGRPVGVDTLPHIEHLVYFVMENHSFDNYFGMLGRGDGLTRGAHGVPTNFNPDQAGHRVPAYHSPSVCQSHYSVGQDWNRSHVAWNHGRNDGFLKLSNRRDAMAYFTEADIPFYYSLGRTFPLCDRYFSSLMGQTDPNRRFMVAATSVGQVNDTSLTGLLATPPPPNGTIF